MPDKTKIFAVPQHVAQVNLPEWDRVESSMRGIFERSYFSNHGPLVKELDEKFAELQGVENAICVVNGTIALMLLAKAIEKTGDVIVPSFTFPATVQSLIWAGLRPVFCDVDPGTHKITAEIVEPLINKDTVAVLGVSLWGEGCDSENLEELCELHKVSLIFDSCHSVGCSYNNRNIGNFGAGEAFSFHATKVLNAGEGGCITTNDPILAKRIKTMRSFHAQETYFDVPLRFNAKMSEAQAAFGLLSIEDLEKNIAANKTRYEAYLELLKYIPGINLHKYKNSNNYQYIVITVEENTFGMSRDKLMQHLKDENIICRRHFYPGVHRMAPFLNSSYSLPVTDDLCFKIMQLPNGQNMDINDVGKICRAIETIYQENKSPVKTSK